MKVDRDLIPMREAAAVLRVTVDALRACIRRGTIEAHKDSGRWMVVVPVDVQDAAKDTATVDLDAAARIATLEATLEHERAQVASSARAHERITLALPAADHDPPR